MNVVNADTSVIYCEDNLRRVSAMPSASVDLVYLDPPFFSNRHYEVIWGDEAEVRSFEDRWEGGVHAYIDWMAPRLTQLHRVLKPTGSLYLHCDPNASHYLKVLLDRIFGLTRFRSEIVWKRSSAHSDTKQGRAALGSIHDTILLYTKSDQWTWNTIYLPYDDAYVAAKYPFTEPNTGRRFGLWDMTGPGGASKGNPEYEVMGVRRHWRYSRERMAALLAEGRVVQSAPGKVPRFKRYLDEAPGVPLQDLWTDLSPVNSQARERLGYPTQKPEALLERILTVSSNEGDVVLDPFCGCGTTIAVAQKLKRPWIGIDISPTAVSIMRTRVERRGALGVTVEGLATSEADLRQLGPFEFQNWIVQQINATPSPRRTGDMGIDGLSFMEHLPIQIKQSDRVGRNIVDNFETAIERAGKHAGYIIAFSFTRGAHDEAARARQAGGPSIGLVKVEDLLTFAHAVEGANLNDLAELFREHERGRSDDVPDLLRLFAAATRRRGPRPLPDARPKSAKPKLEELIASARRPRRTATSSPRSP